VLPSIGATAAPNLLVCLAKERFTREPAAAPKTKIGRIQRGMPRFAGRRRTEPPLPVHKGLAMAVANNQTVNFRAGAPTNEWGNGR
jgi:hypothetical protein